MIWGIVIAVATVGFATLSVASITGSISLRFSSFDISKSLQWCLVGLGLLSYAAVWVTWASPKFATMLIPILGMLGSACLPYFYRGASTRRSQQVRWLAVVVVTSILFVVGITFLWTSSADPFEAVRLRFYDTVISVDNELPFRFASTVQQGLPTAHFAGDWNGSDRPPLQAGFEILTSWLGAGFVGLREAHFAAGIVAQSLWIPILFLCLRTFGRSTRSSQMAILFTVVSGVILVNTAITWPKLFAAAFVLNALVFTAKYFDERNGRLFNLLGMGLSLGLGLLAHTASALCWPIFVCFVVFKIYKTRVKRSLELLRIVAAALLAGVVYLPWILYQRFVDPPGDQLAKWNLAGVTNFDKRPFVDVFIEAYSRLKLDQWVAQKFFGLRTILGLDAGTDVTRGFVTRSVGPRVDQYFLTVPALGLGVLVLFIALFTYIRRWRIESKIRETGIVLLGCIFSLVFWDLTIWGGGTMVHQGSLVWLLLLLALPYAWLWDAADRLQPLLTAFLVGNFFWTLFLYVPSVGPAASFSRSALVLLLSGVTGLAWSAGAFGSRPNEFPKNKLIGGSR